MELCSESEVAKMLPLVSPQRREQALRFKHTHGQFCCLKSYLMLQELVAAISPTLDGQDLLFEYNEHGKPHLAARPDIHFSISHTKNAIAVAIHSRPVGLDIEQIRTPGQGLIEKTMNAEEQRTIAEAGNPSEAFTALWTRKEAVLKLHGTGIIDDLHDVLSADDTIKTIIRPDLNFVMSWAE